MYYTYITYTHYGQVHQDRGLADHVWQDKRAAIIAGGEAAQPAAAKALGGARKTKALAAAATPVPGKRGSRSVRRVVCGPPFPLAQMPWCRVE